MARLGFQYVLKRSQQQHTLKSLGWITAKCLYNIQYKEGHTVANYLLWECSDGTKDKNAMNRSNEEEDCNCKNKIQIHCNWTINEVLFQIKGEKKAKTTNQKNKRGLFDKICFFWSNTLFWPSWGRIICSQLYGHDDQTRSCIHYPPHFFKFRQFSFL